MQAVAPRTSDGALTVGAVDKREGDEAYLGAEYGWSNFITQSIAMYELKKLFH